MSKIDQIEKFVNKINLKVDFEDNVKILKTQNQTLENKTDDLEARSMRENLLFHGIPEMPNENCETLIQEFLTDKLNIAEDIKLDRAIDSENLRDTIDLLS